MEQKELRAWEARCIQEESPACSAGCPVGVDARGFVQAVHRGDLAAARTLLEKSMPLAGIVGRLCEAPCEQYCLRRELGGAIAIGLLERYCVSTVPAKGKLLRLPPRKAQVTVAGGGPSGLTVAYDLAKKGYPVTVYHSGEYPGAWLRHLAQDRLPSSVMDQELQRLETLGIQFHRLDHCDARVFETAQALFLGFDDALPDQFQGLRAEADPQTRALEREGWFAGGLSPHNHSYRFITDVSQGREAAVSIDRYLQKASLTSGRKFPAHGKTDLYTNTRAVEPITRIAPASSAGFDEQEAADEAARCLDCQCLECVRHCRYLAEYGSYPKTYARRVYNNSAIVKGTHQANAFINSCSLCRQCEEFCPNDFSMADLCLEARQLMVREDRMPPSAHWFALEEMQAAQEEAALACHAPGRDSSTFLFFPGCQLAGIRPEQTLHLYATLAEMEPATGIWLDCCGIPAHWAGRETLFAASTARLAAQWNALGQPELLIACSSCLAMFRQNLPEIPVHSVWEVLCDQVPEGGRGGGEVAISDPCTARYDRKTREAVRVLVERLGHRRVALPMSEEVTECCGFGGLMENANPAMAAKVAQARVSQTEATMLTYCAMCRDQLAKTGRPVAHILDFLYPDHAFPADAQPQTLSARRINRRRLREQVLSHYSAEELPPREPWEALQLEIAAPVAAKLEQRRILEDDIRRVLYTAGEQGKCFRHGAGNTRLASAQLGAVIFWVLYSLEDDRYTIQSGWSHRMTIHGGAT